MLDLSNLETTIQGKVDALGPSTDEKTLLLLSKAIEAAVGSVSVSEIVAQATMSIGQVAAAGTSQISAVNAAGAAKVTELNAMSALQKSGGKLTGPVRGTLVTLADAATITPDFATGQLFKVILGGSRVLGVPTITADMVGQSGYILIGQDGTGNRTLSAVSTYKTMNNVGILLSVAANKWDRYNYSIVAVGEIQLTPAKGY